MRLVKTHGSLNEIFALDAAPSAWASDAALRAFVRRICDRDSWTGGSDGIYLYDASVSHAQAWFFNPDGSSAEFCGNGMRGLGRLILDLRGTDTEVVVSGGREYTVHRAPSTPEGVRQVLLELPPLTFDDADMPGQFADFTAVRVPNPHVISIVAEYREPDLVTLGEVADDAFPEGANVSFLLPLGDPAVDAADVSQRPGSLAAPQDPGTPEVFVRTYERGAGLTPSCGSGVVASRAAYSKLTGIDPRQRLIVRNVGGVAAASIQVRGGAWYPVLEGNATIVYRVNVDEAGNQAGPIDYAAEENAAYTALDERNKAVLKSQRVAAAQP